MSRSTMLRAGADLVLMVHAGYAAFVAIGLLLIVWGGVRRWRWVRNPWFRLAHTAAIGVVVVESWLGVTCPLTVLETDLRERAGGTAHGGSWVAYWLQRLLFYDAPPWVFVVGYTLFAALVAGTWIAFRPRPFRHARAPAGRR